MNSRELLFGEAFNDFLIMPPVGVQGLMKSDIYSQDGNYVLEIDMPGFKKEDLKIDFENGYLNITAKKEEETGDREFIRRERYFGEYKRSYHVGPIDETKVKANFETGILKVVFPRNDKEAIPKKLINIE